GGGGAPRVVRVLARHPLGLHVTRQARRLTRRLASHTGDARLPALHRGGFGLRSRASLTGIASGSVTASSSRPGRSARRAGSRTSRGSGYKPPPRDATPRSAAGGVRTTPFVSKAGIFLLHIANRSQELNSACTKKISASCRVGKIAYRDSPRGHGAGEFARAA